MTTYPLWNSTPGLCEEEPVLEYYPAIRKTSSASVVIYPGGGYCVRAPHEGKGYAEFFNTLGMDAFVCEYRVSPHRFPLELLDARRAVRWVRAHAAELKLDPDKVAVMGSSAGGHLAGTAANLYAEALTSADEGNVAQISSRPDFHILCYAVLTLREEFTHRGTRDFICGGDLSLRETLSLETRVHADTPPAFIWHTLADTCVPAENALWYASALRKAKVPFELHVYEKCGHGIGLGGGHPWAEACCRWLETLDSRKV